MNHIAALMLLAFSVLTFSQTKQAGGIDQSLLAKAQSGDANAQYQISLIYAQTGNVEESCRWKRIAAENGNAEAQFSLAESYQDGFCKLSKDASQSVIWLTKSAQQGYFLAQDELASIYYNGSGVAKDYSQAAIWWRKSAEQEYPDAQYNLVILYYNGEGVPQDYVRAEQWFRKAAVLRRGNSDPEEWARMAANDITAKAEYMLGKIYLLGQGTSPDDSEAAICYRKAAELGNADAQNSLGMLYFFGKGVPQDYTEAYFWLNIAASGKLEIVPSEEADKERGTAASHLTNTVLLQTQERARKWSENHK
jgi:uncharacterized protein